MTIAQKNALLRFYFGIDPKSLNLEQWIREVARLDFALDFNGQYRRATGQIFI
jgi:hypothetical protein